MYCHNCGNKISDNAAFCPYCGLGTVNMSDTSGIPSSDKRKKQLPITLTICIVLIVGLLCFFAGKLLWADNSEDIAAEIIVADEAESTVSEEVNELTNNIDTAPAENAHASGQRVFDYAEVFTPEEIVKLETSMHDIIENSGLDIAVLSQSEGIENTQEYAEDFYTENNLGIGSDQSGILFFLDLQNDTYYICTAGSMNDVITDTRMESFHTTHDIFLKQGSWYDVISLSFIMLDAYLQEDGYISPSLSLSSSPAPASTYSPNTSDDDNFNNSSSQSGSAVPAQFFTVINNYFDALSYDSSEVFEYFDETDLNVEFIAHDMTEGSQLEYSFHDINSDGVPELLIRCLNSYSGPAELIDMYSMNGEKTVRTFGSDSFGYRQRLHLLNDGRLLTEGSSSAFCCSCEIYKLNSDGSLSEEAAYFYDTRGDEEEYFGNNYIKLSESDYYSKLEGLPRADFNRLTWTPIYPNS